jgi:hypothetical protein
LREKQVFFADGHRAEGREIKEGQEIVAITNEILVFGNI